MFIKIIGLQLQNHIIKSVNSILVNFHWHGIYFITGATTVRRARSVAEMSVAGGNRNYPGIELSIYLAT